MNVPSLAAGRRRFALAPSSSPEALLLACCLFWAAACNGAFFSAALAGQDGSSRAVFALAAGVGLAALNFALVAPLAWRWTLKPVLSLLIVATACASYYVRHYGVYLDPSMLRNVLHTDWHEARELLTWGLFVHLLLYAGLPLLLLARWRVVWPRWPQALLRRALSTGLALALFAVTVFIAFQPLASLMRNQHELRYSITPANYLWSLAALAGTDLRGVAGPRQAIGVDAVAGPSWASRPRPLLVVLVVGETARAANWGLDGYHRQTTPELARLPVISFADVTSCGTSTEVSLPCMFAPVGRRDYDEARIRRSESLLHVLARAGVGVTWRDNQSGCKGVCDGLPTEAVSQIAPALCADGRCLDEGLLQGLDERLRTLRGTNLLVLHQLGNHGPSYFRRYPPDYARFLPACESDDLRRCSREQIVNAYDNALLYTDHLLATLIRELQTRAATVDSAVVYVSDHGESLGENRLYLHGIPFPIAPDVQKKVPMLMWLSDDYAADSSVDLSCLRRRAAQPASHDNLFHTLLGLLDVRSAVYESDWDLAAACRRPAARAAGASGSMP